MTFHSDRWHRHSLLLLASGLAVGILIAFGSSARFGFVDFDDGLLIYENPTVQELSPRNIWRAFSTLDPELYIPLPIVSYQIDEALGGGSPLPFHMTNLLLHWINAMLATLVLSSLLRSRIIGVLCGMLFAVHPLQTEAVVWASARKDLLMTTFSLASMLCFLSWQRTTSQRAWYGSLGFFLLALLSKVTAAALAPVFLLLEWKIVRNRPLSLIPFFALAAAFSMIAYVGKDHILSELSPLAMLLLGCRAIFFLLTKLILPTHLSPLYPVMDGVVAEPVSWIALLAFAITTLVVTMLARKHRDIAVGWWFFVLTLAPNFFNVYKGGDVFLTTDRYAYLPSLGIFFLVGLAVRHLAFSNPDQTMLRLRMMTAWCVAIAALLVSIAYRQTQVWRTSQTLFTHSVLQNPDFYLGHYFLGNVLRKSGLTDIAIDAYRASLIRNPLSARVHEHLGHAYAEKGMWEEAAKEYGNALSIDPGRANAHFGLGVVYAHWQFLEDAEREYRLALEGKPGAADVSVNLGALLGDAGRLPEEIAVYETALEKHPTNALLHFNLARAFDDVGRVEDAMEHRTRALTLNPSLEDELQK